MKIRKKILGILKQEKKLRYKCRQQIYPGALKKNRKIKRKLRVQQNNRPKINGDTTIFLKT